MQRALAGHYTFDAACGMVDILGREVLSEAKNKQLGQRRRDVRCRHYDVFTGRP